MIQRIVKTIEEIFFPFTFTYFLSSLGREASLLQGGDGLEEQKISGEITLKDAKRIGRTINAQAGITDPKFSFAYGSTKLPHSGINPAEDKNIWDYDKQTYDQPQSFESLWADYVKIYDEQQIIVSEAKTERAQLAQNFLADPAILPYFNVNSNAVVLKGRYSHTFSGSNPVFIEIVRRHEANLKCVREREEKAAAERKVEEERRETVKKQQIAEWVSEHGTANQKERFETGLLPVAEVADAIKNQTFAPLDGFLEYERIDDSDVRASCDESCRCSYDSGCSISCNTNDEDSVTAEQWEQIKAMRALLPVAEFTLRKHYCQCEDSDCEAGAVKRFSIYVKIKTGEFVFNRNYAVEG